MGAPSYIRRMLAPAPYAPVPLVKLDRSIQDKLWSNFFNDYITKGHDDWRLAFCICEVVEGRIYGFQYYDFGDEGDWWGPHKILQDYSDDIYASIWKYLEKSIRLVYVLFDLIPHNDARYVGNFQGSGRLGGIPRFFYLDEDSTFFPSSFKLFSPTRFAVRGGRFGYESLSDPYWVYSTDTLYVHGDVVYNLDIPIGSTLQYFLPFVPLLGKITGGKLCDVDNQKLICLDDQRGGLNRGVGCIRSGVEDISDKREPLKLYAFDLMNDISWEDLLFEGGLPCVVPSKVRVEFVNEPRPISWGELEGTTWWYTTAHHIPYADAKSIWMLLYNIAGKHIYWNIVSSFPYYHVETVESIETHEVLTTDEEIQPIWVDSKVLEYDFSSLFNYTGIYKVSGTFMLKNTGPINVVGWSCPFTIGVLHIGDVDISISKKTYVNTGTTIVTYTIDRGFIDLDNLKYEIIWLDGGVEKNFELRYPVGQLSASRTSTDFKLCIYYNDELVKTIDITDINEVTIGDVPLPIAYYISSENRVHVEWDNETYECYERLVNITGTTSWVALSSSPYDWYPAVGVNLAAIYKLKHRTLGIEGPSITVEINNELVRTEIVNVNREYIEVGEVEIDAYARRPQLYFVYDTVIPNGAAGFNFLVYGDFDETNLSYSFDGVHFQPFTMGDIIYFPEVPNLDHLWVRFESSNVRYVQSAYIKFIF